MCYSRRVAALAAVCAATLAGGNVLAAERYRCDTTTIRDCSPTGCTDVAASGSIALDLPARTYRLCFEGDCHTGAVETWLGRIKPEDKGIVGFSQLGKVDGFTGSADLDSGELVLIDGNRYWFGRCSAE